MNRREKLLALIIGATVLLFGSGYGLRALLTKPLKEIDKKTAALREKLGKITAERNAYFTAEKQVKRYAQLAFSDQVDQASAKSGEMLTQQLLQCGLQESDFSRMPVGPRKLHGASEIGWSVQGEGKLDNVINLIFVLQESPYLHRVENLVVTPSDIIGRVKVRLRYLTLALDPAPIVEPIELRPKFALSSLERRMFDAIARRDILRPYIKRSPADQRGPGSPGSSDVPGTPPGPESFRVVSLSEWMGLPEIHVHDLVNQTTRRYKPGDVLASGNIIMVDYRALPLPGKPDLNSFSRVILKIGAEYWAIERGQTLADKYKLSPEQLPEQLASLSK